MYQLIHRNTLKKYKRVQCIGTITCNMYCIITFLYT